MTWVHWAIYWSAAAALLARVAVGLWRGLVEEERQPERPPLSNSRELPRPRRVVGEDGVPRRTFLPDRPRRFIPAPSPYPVSCSESEGLYHFPPGEASKPLSRLVLGAQEALQRARVAASIQVEVMPSSVECMLCREEIERAGICCPQCNAWAHAECAEEILGAVDACPGGMCGRAREVKQKESA